jgi:hypothetical protein
MFKRKIHILILLVIALSLFILPIEPAHALDTGVNAVNNSIKLGQEDPRTVVGRIINIAIMFLGVIAVGIIIVAGFKWMMAGGEEEKINDAKNLLKNGVIGLIIVLSSWGIATFILERIMDSTGNSNPNIGCTNGETVECGCNGVKTCVDGSWGFCTGSNCEPGSEESCDGNTLTDVCDQDNSICDDSSYCNEECVCQELGEVGNACDADINSEEGVCSQPDDEMCGEYLTCDTDTCTCQGSPIITSISPYGGFCENDINSPCLQDSDCSTEGDVCNLEAPNGTNGNLISIHGYNFSTSTEAVFLGDIDNENDNVVAISPSDVNENCNGFLSNSLIIAVVPDGVNTGAIAVQNADDGLSDNTANDLGPYIDDFVVNNIERPGLCTLNPDKGVLTDEVLYQGLKLSASDAYFGTYDQKFRGLSSDFVENSGTTLVPNIQKGEMTSFVMKEISGFPVKSNYLNFSKEAEADKGPFINSFSPPSGPPGQYVTIKGSGFGKARGFNQVFFGNYEASYDFPSVCQSSVWSDNEVIVKVPENAENGDYTINMQIDEWEIDSMELNPNSFIVVDSGENLKPSLCKIEPIRGPSNSPVTLYGEYFGDISSQATVRFYNNQDKNSKIIEESDYLYIETQVPQDASTGPVLVKKGSLLGNSLDFSVEQCEVDEDCGQQVCCPAGTYKEGRCTDKETSGDTYANCFVNIPSSLYQWNFSTDWGTNGPDPDDDPCSDLDEAACTLDNNCCYDVNVAEGEEASCRSGDDIGIGENASYCAYYECQSGETNYLCNLENPSPYGEYENQQACTEACAYNDPCSDLDEAACTLDNNCCYDVNVAEGEEASCRSGDDIGIGENASYCAYYECQSGETNYLCNLENPSPYGEYLDEAACVLGCADDPDDPDDPSPGASCSTVEEDNCDISVCGAPLACLNEEGALGTNDNCGYCCCNANNTNTDPEASDYDTCLDINEDLGCVANKTPCEGENRGLCCGCSSDNQCGNDQAGCGLDTCCRARPQVLADEVAPSHMQSNVCRNTMISVPFDQKMNRNSFNNNILLLAEYDYGSTCPAGTFLANKELEKIKLTWWQKFKPNFSKRLTAILARLNLNSVNRALADWNSVPTEDDLYCLVPGTVGYENNPDGSTTLTYSPNKALAANTVHYVVVKGDEYMDSSTGVKSYENIGMNGFGYWDINESEYIEGADIKFNNIIYYNSHIFKFETLSDQGDDPGICKIDYVRTEPDSYLFSTTQNSLEENDNNPNDTSYDTIQDRDKEYQAKAFSINGQRLARTSIYNWKWNWYIDNTDVLKFTDQNMPEFDTYTNKQLISTANNISDGKTFVKATVDMSEYSGNITNDGDGASHAVFAYVFICDNPWPAPNAITNAWSPWMDVAENCSLPGEECQSYNYNFYYCRDSGEAGVYDDLPAIIDDNAVIRGSSKVCSDGSGACSIADDCANPEAQCIWDVLKESYFFREAVPGIGTISQVSDLETGGSLKVSWSSDSYLVNNYILYYRDKQSQTYEFVEINLDGSSNPDNPNAGQACFEEGSKYVCNYVVNNLEDNKTYYFKVSAITDSGSESPLSNEAIGVATDKQAPTTPMGLGAENN